MDSLDYWVEVYDTSKVTQDIEIQMKYGAATNTVKATGVWAIPTAFTTQGTALSAFDDGANINGTFVSFGGHLGKQTMQQPSAAALALTNLTQAAQNKSKAEYNTNNMVEIEFTVTPSQMWAYSPIVKFDVSRSADVKYKNGDAAVQKYISRNQYIEMPNDERKYDNDNDLYSKTLASVTGFGFHDKLYSIDGPGKTLEQRILNRAARFQYHGNFFEFVRAEIGGGVIEPGINNALQGSRTSDYLNWSSWLDLNAVDDPSNPGNKIWERGPNARNTIQQVHQNIDDFQ